VADALGKAGRRFRRYDGGDPLAAPVDVARALDAIGESVMGGTSPERAMREYLRRGDREQLGLDDLARRVSERRRELLQRNNLDGTLQEVQKLLERAVLEEKKQLARDVTLDELDRSFSEMRLENLPASTSAAVSELSDYDWKSRQAREDYAKIQELLGRELLDQRFAGMKQALEGATDEDREAIGEMLNDLNALLEKRAAGTDTPDDFAEFMEKNGQYFPENPQSLDELLDTMAKRSAAAQRAFNSMTPEQQQELMQLSACSRCGRGRTGPARRTSTATTRWASATPPASCRISPISTGSRISSRSRIPVRAWTTSTSTRSRASSGPTRLLTRARCASSRRPCATAAPCAAIRPAACSSPRRRCGSSASLC